MKILITGCSRGLGYELAKVGLLHGHTVLAGWLGEPEDPTALENLFSQYPDNLSIIQMDVTSETSVQAAARFAEEKYGSMDCVVNNAGVLFESKFDARDPITTLDIGMLRKTIEVNTVAHAIVLKYFAPLLYRSTDACIINITSEAGHLDSGGFNYLAYGISKHAANMYSQKIRNYLVRDPEKQHIRLFMMHPGRMNTVMGAENAQIEPMESAYGIYDVIEKRIDPKMDIPFINYKGDPMPY